MKTKIIVLSLLVILVLLPTTTQAYFTTDQTATALGSNVAVFTITYRFGSSNYDFYLPTTARRNVLHDTNDQVLGYTLRDDDNHITDAGITTAVIKSSASVVDGKYLIPVGTSETFELIVLLQTDPYARPTDYTLQVESLPFQVHTKDGRQQPLQLNPSGLQYYVTPTTALNETPGGIGLLTTS